jgi:Mn2+/Fe2+ NRAMP family transporter
MEAANVATLYFFPGSKYANGVGVFKAWEKSKSDPEIHNFVKYLVNWVAGTKLIFILLLIVILLVADDRTLVFAGIALVISIASFFWRLFPLIRKMDRTGQIEPEKYSVALGWMIAVFILVFAAAVIFSFFVGGKIS